MGFYTDCNSRGTRVRSPQGDKGGYVQFDNDPPIPIIVEGKHLNGYYISAAHQYGMDYVLVMSNPSPHFGILIARNDQIWKEPKCCGQWSVWLTDNGLICTTLCDDYYTINGQQFPIPPPGKTSQGFQQVNNDGTVIFNYFQPDPVFKGVKFLKPRYSGDWWVGQKSTSNLILAYNTTTDTLYEVADVYTPVGCKITQLEDGSAVVSISLPINEKYLFVESKDFKVIEEQPLPAFKPDKYARKMFLAPYDSYSNRYGITSRPIGNMAFPYIEYVSQMKVPTIMAFDTYMQQYENKCLYYYTHCGGNKLDNGKAQYEFFNNKPEKPRILYLDGDGWPEKLPDWIDERITFPSIQMYRNKNESLSAFSDRMIKVCKIVKQYKLPMVANIGCYDRNGSLTIDQILECFPVYDEMLREYRFIGIMPFSDMRPDGMVQYPILYDYLQLMYNAIPSRPNRLDGWNFENIEESIRIKLDYEMPMFSDAEIDYIKGLLK